MQNTNQTKKGKPLKQTPEVRAYFRNKATERRLKNRICDQCKKEKALYKNLDTKQKLCARCIIPEVKTALTKTPEPQT
jgi:hypothetical protein